MQRRIGVLWAAIALFAIAAEAGVPVSVQLVFQTRRGQRPQAEETVVWLEPVAGMKVPMLEPGSYQMQTRLKTLIPKVLIVPVGSTVRFPNLDPISHNLFSLSPKNAFDLGLYRKGAGKDQRFDAPGIVNVYCNVHPSMSAIIFVSATPYVTLARDGGSASFPDVAPGHYRLIAWNEQVGSASTEIDVGQAGRAFGLTIDGRSFRFSPVHTDKEGRAYRRRSTRDY